MSEQLSEKGKDLVKYMPQAVNALADRLIEKLEERLLYGEKPQTNADRIRAMSDEELAELFADNNCGYCRIHDFCFAKGCAINCEDMWLDWLREECD